MNHAVILLPILKIAPFSHLSLSDSYKQGLRGHTIYILCIKEEHQALIDLH